MSKRVYYIMQNSQKPIYIKTYSVAKKQMDFAEKNVITTNIKEAVLFSSRDRAVNAIRTEFKFLKYRLELKAISVSDDQYQAVKKAEKDFKNVQRIQYLNRTLTRLNKEIDHLERQKHHTLEELKKLEGELKHV